MRKKWKIGDLRKFKFNGKKYICTDKGWLDVSLQDQKPNQEPRLQPTSDQREKQPHQPAAVEISKILFTEEQFQMIENILKPEIGFNIREKLTDASIWFLAYKANQEGILTLAPRREALKKINRQAKDFAECLRELDDEVRIDLAKLESEEVFGKIDSAIQRQFEPLRMWDTIDRAEEDASRIHMAAIVAIKRLKNENDKKDKKTTKPINVPLYEYIKT